MKYLLLLSLLIVSCKKDNAPKAKKVDVKKSAEMSINEKIFYAQGYSYGDRIKKIAPTAQDTTAFIAGAQDSFAGKEAQVNIQAWSAKLADLIEEQRKEKAAKMIAESASKVQEIVSAQGLEKSESGLYYKVLVPGKKRRIQDGQGALLAFKAMHINGDVFEKTPAKPTYFYPYSGMLKAWREALSHIGPGGKIMIVAPSDLAYGDAGAPPKVLGGETIIFELELLKIKNIK